MNFISPLLNVIRRVCGFIGTNTNINSSERLWKQPCKSCQDMMFF